MDALLGSPPTSPASCRPRGLRAKNVAQTIRETLSQRGAVVQALCLCPNRDSGDLPLWFVVVVFNRSFVERFQSQRGVDDRSKGDGFQTQKTEGFLSGQVRKDEMVERRALPLLFRNQDWNKSHVSQMQGRHSDRVAWTTFASRAREVRGQLVSCLVVG